MAKFKDAEEVYTYLGGMFNTVVHEPSIIAATAGTGLVVRIIQTDPDAEMVVDFAGQKVFTGGAADGLPAAVELGMSSDDSNAFWQGKLNLAVAMVQRKVTLEGKRSVALKLLPLTKGLFETYIESLKSQGREDLLVP